MRNGTRTITLSRGGQRAVEALVAKPNTPAKVLTKTVTELPAGATHWSVRSMAREMGISHTSVQRIWRAAGIKPRSSRTW